MVWHIVFVFYTAIEEFVPALNISKPDNDKSVMKDATIELIHISADEETRHSANVLFLGKLDEWIHLVVSEEESKRVSFANGKREHVKTEVLNIYRNTLQASVNFYTEISKIASKQGYEKEAERYMLIAEIYESIRCHNKEEA